MQKKFPTEKEYTALIIRLKKMLAEFGGLDFHYSEYVAHGLYNIAEVKGEAYLNFSQREKLRNLFQQENVEEEDINNYDSKLMDDDYLPFPED